MGYKFEVKQAGNAIVRGFSEPVDSSLGTKWPCKKSAMVIIALVILLCLSIGIGVGIHVLEMKRKEKSSRTESINTEEPAPSTCPWLLEDAPLILITLGAFRSDYLSENITPNINELSRLGVHAPHMTSVNPTLTLPNLYSIVTGLYPESHGIVHNSFTDPTTKAKFDIKNTHSLTDRRWWKGEPIWVTLGRQNKKTASIGWPGTDVNLPDFNPILFKMNKSQNSLLEPIQEILRWLNYSSNQRPNLILWYIDHAVKTSQTFGPNSPLVKDKFTEIDEAVSNLWKELNRKFLRQCVNLIIVSDHGMSVTSSERIFNFQSLIPSQNWTVYGDAFSMVKARKNIASNDIADFASTLECKHQNVKVFIKSSAPKRYHIFNNPRSGDLFLLAKDRWLSSRSKYTRSYGSSGYDNRYRSMRSLFMAVGPGFQNHSVIEPFENIELYNMISKLLKVEPAKNNGTAGSLHHALSSAKPFLKNSEVPNNCEKPENWTLIEQLLNETSCFNKTSMKSHLVSKLRNALKNRVDILNKHVPMGPPVETERSNCYRLLYQTDFVVGSKDSFYMPLWSSTTLDRQTKWTDKLTGPPSQQKQTKCVFTDARLSIENEINGFEDQEIGYLYNLDFLDSPESYLSSNAVPMFKEFRNGIWKFMWQTLKQYSKFQNINVVVGPIFDSNHDGITDLHDSWIDTYNSSSSSSSSSYSSSKLLIPSHFFVVLSKCREKRGANMSKCLIEDKLDVLSFVLPHRRQTDNCMNLADFLEEHTVRIRDIELLTGLVFFESFSQEQLAVIRRRLFLPDSLWPSYNTKSWLKQPCLSDHKPTCPRDPTVLLILLSGFSPSHFRLFRTPVLDKIRNCGLQAKHMRPVYPSNELPNAYTIVTGLYPESHGLLTKSIYDNMLVENKTSWKQEAIWVTGEKQNKTMALLSWPGFDASSKLINDSKWIKSSRQIGVNRRIQTILDWLSVSGNERPDFICTHFEEPDLTSRKYGANSHQIENALTNVDEFMGQLMDGIKEKNLEACIDLIILSDHGIQSTSIQREVNIDAEIIDSFITEGATLFKPAGLQQVEVNETLNPLHCNGFPIRAYTKATLPRRLHFTKNVLIGDVILSLDDGWIIKSKSKQPKSTHGYDNRFESMQAIFLAYGPSFKNNMTVEPFESIELYNLLTDLLHIRPASNNGTKGALNKMLKESRSVLRFSPAKYLLCCSSNSTSSEECSSSNTHQNYLSRPNHIPFGVPIVQTSGNYCLFHTDAFSQAKNNDSQMPLWLSYSIPQTKSRNNTSFVPSSCTTFEDHSLNITTGNLYISEDSNYSTGAVPMYKGFKEGVWNEIIKLIHEYTVKYTRLNVITGPVFEHGFSGAKMITVANCSVPVPTHFFAILSKMCSANDVRSCNESFVEVLPFILPHVEKDQNCLKPKDYIFDHTARIRDIEELTGLTFMTALPPEESIRTRIYLPLELWEGLRPSSWMKLPHCINLDRTCKNSNRPVLLFSLDGFRSDYTKYNVTPVIDRLRHCGIQTPFMQSVFPSKTFPNHYTIATGLYPESHGIVGNYMYDMEKDMVFTMASTEPFWWGGEPIWKSVVKAGKESASYFFVGSSISGNNASYYYTYSGKTSYEARIDQVVLWLKQGIPFVSAYFEEPDSTGHREGPSSKQIMNTLRLVDSYIGRLMDKLYEEDLHNCINIILLADHGMADISCERSIVLWDIINKKTATNEMFVYSDGRVTNKYWQEKKIFKKFLNGKYAVSISDLMSKLECGSRHMRVFQKEFLPKRLHYAKHNRTGDIQLLIDDRWYLQRRTLYCRGRGSHGYDNLFKSMNALFLAYGPDFKQQMQVEPFQNIEIYNLLADMLNVTAAPNNGTDGRLHRLMRRPPLEPLRQSVGQYKYVHFNMTHGDLANFLKENKCLNFTPTNKEVSLLHDSLVGSNLLTNYENISFGLPLLKKNVSIQLLRHPSYLTAYDPVGKKPLFIVTWARNTSYQPLTNYIDKENGCMVDPRMPSTVLEHDSTENINSWLNLAQIGFAFTEKQIPYLSTNFIRAAKCFKKVLWNEAMKFIHKWWESFSSSSCFVGPVYDYNLDGLADDDNIIKRFTNESLPTHVFVVLVACDNTGEIEATTAFVIPSNQHHLPKCRSTSQLLLDHQARVRDVELLTNMEFFPRERFLKAVVHRTSMTNFLTSTSD